MQYPETELGLRISATPFLLHVWDRGMDPRKLRFETVRTKLCAGILGEFQYAPADVMFLKVLINFWHREYYNYGAAAASLNLVRFVLVA